MPGQSKLAGMSLLSIDVLFNSVAEDVSSLVYD